MDKFAIYKLIHYTGIFVLMFAFGSLFSGKSNNKAAAIGHGVGLFLILLGGFGMQAVMKDAYKATYGSGFPLFLILKIVIWFFFGASMVLAKRQVIKGALAWILIVGLGLGAAFLALQKPFAKTPQPATAVAK